MSDIADYTKHLEAQEPPLIPTSYEDTKGYKISRKVTKVFENKQQEEREKIKKQWALEDLGLRPNQAKDTIDMEEAQRVKKIMKVRRERLQKARETAIAEGGKFLTTYEQGIEKKKEHIRNANSELLSVVSDDIKSALNEFKNEMRDVFKEVLKDNNGSQTETTQTANSEGRSSRDKG